MNFYKIISPKNYTRVFDFYFKKRVENLDKYKPKVNQPDDEAWCRTSVFKLH
jgi:hypothetical protein